MQNLAAMGFCVKNAKKKIYDKRVHSIDGRRMTFYNEIIIYF